GRKRETDRPKICPRPDAGLSVVHSRYCCWHGTQVLCWHVLRKLNLLATDAAKQKCGENEVWNECAVCEAHCRDPDDTICTTECRPATCQCNTGYARSNSGKCIPRNKCKFEPGSVARPKREGTMIGYTGTPKRYLHIQEETVVETATGEPWDSHKSIMTLGKATDAPPKRLRREPEEEVVAKRANVDNNGHALTRSVQSEQAAFNVPAARRLRRQSADAKQFSDGGAGGQKMLMTVSKTLEVRTNPTGDYDDFLVITATGKPTAHFNNDKLPLHNPKEDVPKRTKRQTDLNEKLITGTGKNELWTFHSQRLPIRGLKKVEEPPKSRVRRGSVAPQFLLKEKVGTPEGEKKTPTHSIAKQTFMAASLREGGKQAPRRARAVQ
ncbi:Protein F36H9.4, partial [Aphelenchoides avenae]